MKPTLPFASTVRTPRSPVDENDQRRAGHTRRRRRRQRDADLRGDAVGNRAVGVGHLAPRRGRCAWWRSPTETRSGYGLRGSVRDTSRTSAMSPTLTLASLRSDTSTIASIGSRPTICAISLPVKANAGVPTSRYLGDDAVPRRGDDAAIAFGLGRGKRGLRRLELRLDCVARVAATALLCDQRGALPRARSCVARPAPAPESPAPRALRRTGRR